MCTINMVIFSLQTMFLEPDGEDALCDEAVHLWRHHRRDFQMRVQQAISASALVADFDAATGLFRSAVSAFSRHCEQCTVNTSGSSFGTLGTIAGGRLGSLVSASAREKAPMCGSGKRARDSAAAAKEEEEEDDDDDGTESLAKIRLLKLADDRARDDKEVLDDDPPLADQLAWDSAAPAVTRFPSRSASATSPVHSLLSGPDGSAESFSAYSASSFRTAHAVGAHPHQSTHCALASAQQKQFLQSLRPSAVAAAPAPLPRPSVESSMDESDFDTR